MIANITVPYPTDPLAILGLWVALALMLAIYSYPLWKENPAYRFAEHTFVAASLAIGLIVNIDSLRKTAWNPLVGGQYVMIVPLILGLLMYFLLVPSMRWVSRYPIALIVGSAMGLGIASTPLPSIVNQVISTLTVPKPGASSLDWFGFGFIAVGSIASTMYFLLTYEHKGPLKPVTQLGRYFIMLGLGAYFGNTVLFRFSMLAERAKFILQVLGLVPL